MECGLAHRDGDKGWRGRRGGGGGRFGGRQKKEESERGKKAEKKNKFARSIHRPLARYRCLNHGYKGNKKHVH